MSYFLFKCVNRTNGAIRGAGYRRVEADDLAEAKKKFAKTWPSSEVHEVAEVLWAAPKVPMGRKTVGQADKETRARRASYGKLK